MIPTPQAPLSRSLADTIAASPGVVALYDPATDAVITVRSEVKRRPTSNSAIHADVRGDTVTINARIAVQMSTPTPETARAVAEVIRAVHPDPTLHVHVRVVGIHP